MRTIIRDKEYDVDIKYTAYMRFYEVEILDDDRKRMGKITFKIGRKDQSNETWIYSIATDPDYHHMGVGTTLLKICEYMTSLQGIRVIRGRFMPFNDYARPMYEKNGYVISEYGDGSLFKKIIGIKKTQQTVSKILVEDAALDNFS